MEDLLMKEIATDKSRIVSRIPVLMKNSRSSTRSELIKTNLENQFEDSGYESPNSKTNEDNNYDHQIRLKSAPASMPVIKTTPRLSTPPSNPKFRLRKTISQNIGNPSISNAHLKLVGPTSSTFHSFGDQIKGQACNGGIASKSQAEIVQQQHEAKFENLLKVPLPGPIPSVSLKPIPSVQFPTTPHSLPSFSSMLTESESFQAIKKKVDENVSRILNQGQSEFNGKHSDWIMQVFNLQLEKIHNRLKQAYTEKLNEVIKQKELQLMETKRIYRLKLIDFEEATKKFQTWYDQILEENQRQNAINENLVTQLKDKEVELMKECERKIETEVLKMETNFEKERQKAMVQHVEQLKKINEKFQFQTQTLSDQYEHKIQTLKKEIEHEKIRNAKLKQQRSTAPNNGDGDPLSDNEGETGQFLSTSERVKYEAEIGNLAKAVKKLEYENKTLSIEHGEEIAKLQGKLDENNANLRRLIKETKESIDKAKVDRERRVQEMKMQYQRKDEEHKEVIATITSRYGKKIEELTSSVERLQRQLQVS